MTKDTLTHAEGIPARPESSAQALGGAAFYAFIGTAWAAYGVHTLQGWKSPFPAIGVFLAALSLLIAFFVVRRQAGPQTPPALSPAEQRREAREGRIFAWVNAGQGVAIFLMIQVCVNLHHSEYIAPLFALIVGLHFFVLAPALQTRYLWAIGGLMCLLVLVTLLALPLALWGTSVGLGSGVIYWGSAAFRLRTAQMRSLFLAVAKK